MRISPESLIDGCVRTLLEVVAPAIDSRFARGQLYAVADVLRNLRDRVEPRADAALAESDSAVRALGAAAEALRAAGALEAAAHIDADAARAPATPPQARAGALRHALCASFDVLDSLGDETTLAARRALGVHLAAQALRDVSVLKPSLLAEISKG